VTTMRLAAALCAALLLAPAAAANEPSWTRDQRQAHRDAVFAGRVESMARLYEAEPPELPAGLRGEFPEEVWVARVEVLEIRKGHPLLEAPIVDLLYVRPADPRARSRPAYVELAPGDERLFFAQAALDPVRGEEALFVDLASDAAAGIPILPGIGLRLVTGDWRVWSTAFSELPAAGYEIEFSRSGRVWSENLAGAERWRLDAYGTLELLTEAGSVSYRFHHQTTRFVFAHGIDEGISAGQVIWLGPAGSDFQKLSSRPTVEQMFKMLEGVDLSKIVTYSELRGPVPEIVERYALHGIRLEPSYDEQGGFHEYRVAEPATPGFQVTVQILKFPAGWTEPEVQDHMSSYSQASVVHGRYALFWPGGVDVDEGESLQFEEIHTRLVKLFEEMDLE